MTRVLVLLLCLFWPFALIAQDADEDRGYLTGLLEGALGGEGRAVRIDGFAGAFSSTATINQITVADADGVWLSLSGVEINWNRSALLRGAIEIKTLTAEQIEVARAPLPAPDAGPAPEAQPFALPELPASVRIETMDIRRVAIGAPLLGEAVVLSLSGAAELAGGAADVALKATRLDGPGGQFNVAGSFANDTRALMLDLDLTEPAGGLISGLLNVPDRPSLDLKIAGDGTLNDLAATLALRTDDAPRLEGELRLGTGAQDATTFEADLAGDVTALFLPEYAAFFGTDVRLSAKGARDGTGAIALDVLDLRTRALALRGEVALNADAWPILLDLEGEIADPNGTPVLLPGTGAPLRIDRADLAISFDAEDGDALTAKVAVTGLDTQGVAADSLALGINGTLSGDVNAIGAIRARVNLDGEGFDFDDADVARAIGRVVRGGLDVAYTEDAPLRLSNMALSGADWALRGLAEIDGFDAGFDTDFDIELTASDLSAFAGLAGVALRGEGTLAASGSAALGGFFDVEIKGETRDLGVGIAQADALLTGTTRVDLTARRDQAGTFVDALSLRNPALRADASATLTSQGTQALFDLGLTDVGLVTEAVNGPLTLNGSATQRGDTWTIQTTATGPLDAVAEVAAIINPARTEVDLTAEIPDVTPLVPQISGAARVVAKAVQMDGAWRFDAEVDGPENSTATVEGTFAQETLAAEYALSVPNLAPLVPQVSGTLAADGTVQQVARGWRVTSKIKGPYASTGDVTLTLTDGRAAARYVLGLPNVGSLVPGIAGAVALRGTAQQVATGYEIDANIDGPAGIQARVAGRVANNGNLALSAQGQAQLGLANRLLRPRNVLGVANFDLTVNGPPALSSVRGQITTQGARLAAPNLPLSFDDISGAVTLNGTQGVLDLRAGVTQGGTIRITGPIGLTGGYPANIDIALAAVNVSDAKLYSSTVDGAVRIDGALQGGARIDGTINVGETTVQVPSSGISTFGAVPDINHVGATRPVMRTRDRAGLSQSSDATAAGPAYPLDITVNAPSRIFVRGRGIGAEVGGSLHLTGSTRDTISTGQFNLIRGRMSVLTKRFDLDEGLVQLRGRFEPFLRFIAATTTNTGTARIIIEGPADAPEVTFEATPEAPQDQVLAQIFFGRDITQLSAFQALQLANAVAQLAGRGGEGIVSRLRGSFGLDDLDVGTDDEGNTSVRAGKYISDNVYTDVTVGGAEGPEVSLNIDLTPNITARGSLGADSNTSIGIFIEKDY
ncbi:translocation/assembly module TamB domain-containing protein [uncultured Tateyamaria sp.]|uniref:translocation/assembly module TamB domain-containing protein n=1 Tax=uncultured Tateyamaria sp. TaxID=455651 RepID=UPI002601A7E4|nr:translocation/assembly module TamB domain-containing protein [uncultured Tateyamaria sp.]